MAEQMKGLVESADWDGDSMVYTVRVFRPNHADINIVGHEVVLIKARDIPAKTIAEALADFTLKV